MSKYEDKLAKIADLKKQAETERKAEVIKILEQHIGKVKDFDKFREWLKNNDMERETIKEKIEPVLSQTASRWQKIGQYVEGSAEREITDLNAFREWIITQKKWIKG